MARGKAAAVTRESGEVAAFSLARAVSCMHLGRAAPGQRENTETVAKLPQPRYHAWCARPEDHVITNYLYRAYIIAPEGIIIIHKICITNIKYGNYHGRLMVCIVMYCWGR